MCIRDSLGGAQTEVLRIVLTPQGDDGADCKDSGQAAEHQLHGGEPVSYTHLIVLGIHIVAVGAVGRGEKVTGPGVVLVRLHGAVVRAREDEEQDVYKRQLGKRLFTRWTTVLR